MTVRTIGSSKVTSVNNLPKVLRDLQRRKALAQEAMAQQARQQAQEVFQTDGDGTWDENAQATKDWKGHERVMLGRTGALSEGIEVRTNPETGGKSVGWFQEGHPDSDLSKGALAWEHERDRPWLSKVHDNPERAAAVYDAGRNAYQTGRR